MTANLAGIIKKLLLYGTHEHSLHLQTLRCVYSLLQRSLFHDIFHHPKTIVLMSFIFGLFKTNIVTIFGNNLM